MHGRYWQVLSLSRDGPAYYITGATYLENMHGSASIYTAIDHASARQGIHALEANRDIAVPFLVDDVESSPLIQHICIAASRNYSPHRLVVLFYDILRLNNWRLRNLARYMGTGGLYDFPLFLLLSLGTLCFLFHTLFTPLIILTFPWPCYLFTIALRFPFLIVCTRTPCFSSAYG